MFLDSRLYGKLSVYSYRVFFLTGTPPKNSKLIKARLGVSRPIYVDVDSPNLGFTYFKLFRGVPVKTSSQAPRCAS